MDVQTGPEGCILQCPIGSKLKEVRKTSVEGDSLRVHVPVFWTRPSTNGVYKLLKIPISLLRKINIRVIIHLDNMLILSHTIREAYMIRDTVIYLLQNLGFIINIKKSILLSYQKTKFLGMEIDSMKMTLPKRPEKVQKVVKTCQNLLRSHCTTLLELTRVVGLISSTIEAVEPAKIQLRFLQQQQIVGLRGKNELSVSNTLNTKSRTKLTWWIENLRFWNGRTFSQLNSQIIIRTDASLTGWGAVCDGNQTSGKWSEEERTLHLNVLELLAIKLALSSFSKGKRVTAIHFQIDKKAALS